MALETKPLYEFGRFRLDPAEHLLLDEGKPVSLTPKAFELLLTLIQNNRRLLTKEELMGRVWPDSFVEEANLTVNISVLRKVLGEMPDGRQYIETVPKHGYRFLSSVTERLDTLAPAVPTVDAGRPEAGASNPATAPTPTSQARSQASPKGEFHHPAGGLRAGVLVLVVVALGVLTYSLYRRHSAPAQSLAEPRRLAILPFRNLRQDPSDEFLSLSLADAVITKLGYVSALIVRPSYAIEKYRSPAIDIRKVAADLNIDTLLTGDFIHEGDNLRITCQLIDVKTENILWEGAFDLKYDKLLTVQDNVSQEIIKGLEVTLSPLEAERIKPDQPINPLAYQYYLRGVDLYSRSDFPMAVKMLEKAAELGPEYALTWAYLGRAYNANASFELGGREQHHKAKAAFERALALQPAQIEAHIYMANLFTDTGQVERAVPLLRDALKTNPNHAELHWELGYAYRFAGMLQESVAECERSRRLDPGVKLNTSALNAYLYLGEYEKFLHSLPETNDIAFVVFYRGFGEYYQKKQDRAMTDFERSFSLDPSILQVKIGKALSDGIKRQNPQGLEILRGVENTIEERGVGDPEALYKIAQAYALLGDKLSALRVLRHSIERGFFSYPYFSTDPLLDSLRDQAEFGQLMTAARQRHLAFKTKFF